MRSAQRPARLLERPALQAARFGLRRLQAPLRALPDFVIIGAQKCGTSSLHGYLEQHPRIRAALRKEVHFFDGGLEAGFDSYAAGPSWYRAHFPLRARLAPGARVFEASPLYMLHPLAAERMARLLPRARLIALLRDPVERAISHYFHNVRDGNEDLPLAEALDREEERLAPILARGDFKSRDFRAVTYKARGRYAEQLARFLAHYPRENLLVLRAEDVFADLPGAMARVFRFVGVDPDAVVIDGRRRNVGANREPVEPEVRAGLAAYFAPHNRALADLVGPEFSWPEAGR